ncbi:MAG: hypothetical protein E7399_02875 [Ruminococcaceae bacterium]|nr:hypothetical protein [Oscillospiraceae bacterium]
MNQNMGNYSNGGGYQPPQKNSNQNVVLWVCIGVLAFLIIAFFLTIGIWILRVRINVLPMSEEDSVSVVVQEETPTPIPTPKPEHRYEVYKSNASWYDAYLNARNSGGYLACINSKAEFDRVCALADSYQLKVFWVGATRSRNDNWGQVRWLDGSYFTFSQWYSGEPTYYSDYNEPEEYLMIFKVNGVWYFNDSVNEVSQYYAGKMGYIVEWES